MVAEIRLFKNEDFWQVENLVRLFMNNDPFSPPIIVRQMQELFGPFFLVAQEKSNQTVDLQGYIIGGVKFEDKKIGWILGIYVKEEFRNSGVGDQLLNELINIMKSHGICEIRLTVDPQNDSALKIYRKNGFHEIECIYEHYRKQKTVYLMKCLL